MYGIFTFETSKDKNKPTKFAKLLVGLILERMWQAKSNNGGRYNKNTAH